MKTNKRKEAFRKKTRKLRGGKKGKINYPNGNIYEGDVIMVNDVKTPQGKGQMTYGENNDEPDPEGYANIYVGHWLNGERHGKGKMTYKESDGSDFEYEGDWVNGKKQGKGIMKWGESIDNIYLTYEGDFDNNSAKGLGTMTWKNGNIYVGQVGDCYEDDDSEGIIGPDGRGEMTYGENDAELQRYEGTWENGKKSGVGSILFTDGRLFEGLWDDDLPVCDTDTEPPPYLEGPWFAHRDYREWECVDSNFIDIMMDNNGGFDEDDDGHHEEAVEVHVAASKINLDKYLEALNEPDDFPYPRAKEYIDEKFIPYIRERFPQEKDEMLRKLEIVMNRLNNAVDFSASPRNKEIVKKTIDFVFKQPTEFIDEYIKTFIKDCYSAYSGAQGDAGMSCVAGIFERIYLLVGDIIYQLCPEETTCEYENKEVYEKLLKIFRKRITKASVIQDWAIQHLDTDETKAMSKEARKQHFIEFMRKEYRDAGMLDEQNEMMIQKEANDLDARDVFGKLEFGGAGEPTVPSIRLRRIRLRPRRGLRPPAPPSLKRRSRSGKKTRKTKK